MIRIYISFSRVKLVLVGLPATDTDGSAIIFIILPQIHGTTDSYPDSAIRTGQEARRPTNNGLVFHRCTKCILLQSLELAALTTSCTFPHPTCEGGSRCEQPWVIALLPWDSVICGLSTRCHCLRSGRAAIKVLPPAR